MVCSVNAPSPTDYEEVVYISSIAKLEELTSGVGFTDIHCEKVDHLIIPSKMGKGILRRVEEVFDCWSESGRMFLVKSPTVWGVNLHFCEEVNYIFLMLLKIKGDSGWFKVVPMACIVIGSADFGAHFMDLNVLAAEPL
ncbi:uncharacterized protein HD556DRAFT_1306396 [Suillus plorans]|uniref:Aminoacyl-tRNA synthetase class Ia domain-containing protein n=1 Tax=Suillus plorans TaxID=116603 RepID=A0A9P7IYN8_9AGAM|nr:uncharacterized protein HD556DRAFT_1306396 [Suillus plorans]KAG1797801.1 hypothetical protein HD556DRAFT_1306396 [Suillus plorans]